MLSGGLVSRVFIPDRKRSLVRSQSERKKIDSDLVDLMAFSDPVVQRFSWSQTTPYREGDARNYFVAQESARLRGEEVQFALLEPSVSSKEAPRLGTGSPRRTVAAGCRVDRSLAALDVGFTQQVLARIELTCGTDNEASQRVAARCGYVCEGVIRCHVPFKGGRRRHRAP